MVVCIPKGIDEVVEDRVMDRGIGEGAELASEADGDALRCDVD